MRRSRNYAYDEIDSSPESYRNVSIPKENINITEPNVLNKNPKEGKHNITDDNHSTKSSLHHSDVKNKFSYYLRRSDQNTSIDEKHWIIIENDLVL